MSTHKTIYHNAVRYDVTMVRTKAKSDATVHQGNKVLGTIETDEHADFVYAYLPGSRVPARTVERADGRRLFKVMHELAQWIIEQPRASPMNATLMQIVRKHFDVESMTHLDSKIVLALVDAYKAGEATQ